MRQPLLNKRQFRVFKNHWGACDPEQLALFFGLTKKQVLNLAYRNNLVNRVRVRFSNHEDQVLIMQYEFLHIDSLCKMLNRSKQSIKARAIKLGLKQNRYTIYNGKYFGKAKGVHKSKAKKDRTEAKIVHE